MGDIETKKDYIIYNTNNLTLSEREMIGTIISSKYAHLMQNKSFGTAVDLDKLDNNTINQIYDYVKNAMNKNINQFKN